MSNNDVQLRRLRAIARAISLLVAKHETGEVDSAELAGLYDAALHILETGNVPEGRAAFEMGYTMGARGRSVTLAAEVAARIWTDDGVEPGSDPSEETLERIVRKIEALSTVPA